MADGWICLYRSVKDGWLWKDKPFTKGQAWIDILLEANHKDNKVPIGNQIIEVKRGQKLWSILDMAERWGWSEKKVKNFLNLLQNDEKLTFKSTTKYTLLTIENYSLYQSVEYQKAEQKQNKRRTNAEQKQTNNNDNNDNNDNKNILADYTTNEKLIETLVAFVDMRKKLKKPMNDKSIELLLKKLDKLGSTDTEKIEILENSIAGSWQGIFPLKDMTQQPGKPTFNNHKPRDKDTKSLKQQILAATEREKFD